MRRVFLPPAAFSLIALTACSQAAADSRAIASARFEVQAFDSVALLGPDSVRVLPGDRFSVRATGPQSALDALVIRVDQNTLKVDRKRSHGWSLNWRDNGRAQVIVTMPTIRRATLAGAGGLEILSPTATDQFTATLSGAGDLTVSAAASEAVDIRLSGSGDMVLKGKATRLIADVAGSGDVNADGLPVRTAQLDLAGVGNIRARVSDDVQGDISGVGNIEVRGGAHCTVDKSGVGEVRCAP